jgi:lysozyme
VAETIDGIDISHYQSAIQFHDIVDAGYQFVFAKATQGTSYIDPCFTDFRTRAAAVGLLFGAYHFFVPGVDPAAQAAHFVNVAAPKSGDLVTVLDTETPGTNVAEDSFAFAESVKELTGKYPMIYTGDSLYGAVFADTFPYPQWSLWIARYGKPPVHPSHFVQYSQSGRIGVANVDLDVFNGTMADLKANYLYP